MSTQDEKTDKPGKRSLEEVLREAWLGALGTLERTEIELHRLGERLREAVIGDESVAADLTSRIRQRRAELERRVDEGVRSALARVADPLTTELAALRERLDRLATRLDEQARRRIKRRQAAAGVERDADGADGKPAHASSEAKVDGRSDGVVR